MYKGRGLDRVRVAGVGFGPRPDRCAVGIDRLDVHDSAAPPAAPAATASVVVVVRVPAVPVVVALAPRPTADEADQRLPERRRSPFAGVAAREEEAIVPRRPRAHEQENAEQHEPLIVYYRLGEIIRVKNAAVVDDGATAQMASRLRSSLEGSPRSLILAKWQLRSDHC